MLWPETTVRAPEGHLCIGGVALPELAERFDTPLYVYDATTLRSRARRFRDAFRAAYPRSRIVYAAKAYLSPAVVTLLRDEGLGLDVVSGGELYAGLAAGVPASEITFHGNNKTAAELREALAAGVGAIVLDNRHELQVLSALAAEIGTSVPLLVRLNPGLDVHTHAKIRTGVVDSKFGFPLWNGDAAGVVAEVLSTQGMDLIGYHAHIGSQLLDPSTYRKTVEAMVLFAVEMRNRHGVAPRVISPGGGFGIAYGSGDVEAAVEAWATTAADVLTDACAAAALPLPELVVEPGRAIVGPAGVALYRVGAIKDIPGVRRYVSVDGGMADNIRPALYGAAYTAEPAGRPATGPAETVTIAGKYCESGDLLIENIALPPLEPGNLLAVPAAGAYCLAMASNYNLTPRPAVVMVEDGAARLIRRRETYADLLRCDLVPAGVGAEA